MSGSRWLPVIFYLLRSQLIVTADTLLLVSQCIPADSPSFAREIKLNEIISSTYYRLWLNASRVRGVTVSHVQTQPMLISVYKYNLGPKIQSFRGPPQTNTGVNIIGLFWSMNLSKLLLKGILVSNLKKIRKS